MTDPLIGIIVPFTSWNPIVEECVKGCLDLDYGNFRIVLIPDEGEPLADWVSDESRILVEPTPGHGISMKRNRGFEALKDAEYFALIDSDAYPERSWLSNAMAAFEAHPEVWGVTGPNVSPEYRSLRRKAVANALGSPLILGHRAFMKRRAADRYTPEPYGCNLIIRKRLIETVGPFDETIQTGEDSELCRRVREAGGTFFFSREVVVVHHNRPLFGPFIKHRMTGGYMAPGHFRRDPCFSFGLFLIPSVFLVFVTFGWAAGFVHPAGTVLWLLGIGAFFLITFAEAVRHAGTMREVPLTWVALMIGAAAPGLGTLMALAGRRIDLPSFYANFNAANNPD